MAPTVAILILAAGASTRMRGRDKLMQPIGDQPILQRVAGTALATGMPVWVTLPSASATREAALEGLAVRIVPVPDAQLGMSRSVVRGLEAVLATDLAPDAGLLVLPADMPDFTTEALDGLIRAFRSAPHLIWRGSTPEGQPGHPVIFPRDLWPELAKVTGDEGGRSVLLAHRDRLRLLPLPGTMALRDLDTPEDWAAYLGRPV
ncbi:MAG: NTP transferase domain-containing protein [Tabrizicola sp.]